MSSPPSVGVAYLAETLLIGERTVVLPRRQPLIPAVGASVMAVVRIETGRGFADTPELRAEIAARLAEVARHRQVRALQVDFDAAASQLAFYADVLRMVRPQLPERAAALDYGFVELVRAALLADRFTDRRGGADVLPNGRTAIDQRGRTFPSG